MVARTSRPNAHQIQAFAHTVREGSVSAAARKLGVSQSAVSQHLSKLERASGSKLLLHTRDGMVPTRTGESLYALADGYLSAERLFAERLSDLSQLNNGNLSLTANTPQPALALLSRFCDAFPRVQVDFSLTDWTSSMRMLASRTVDIGVIASPRQSKDLVTHEVDRLRYVLYVPLHHPFARRDHVSLSDMVSEPVILPEEGSLTQRVIHRALAQHSLTIDRAISITTFPVIKEALREGLGVAPFLECSATEAEGLKQVPICELTESFPVCLVAHRERARLHLIETFIAMIEAS